MPKIEFLHSATRLLWGDLESIFSANPHHTHAHTHTMQLLVKIVFYKHVIPLYVPELMQYAHTVLKLSVRASLRKNVQKVLMNKHVK